MNLEIERKFLVKNEDFKDLSTSRKYIKQGYLNSDNNRVVRIRILDKQAFLTIKGKSNSSGLSRFEWEKEISLQDAKEMMELCEPGIIEKYRYYHKFEDHLFEIDEFLGDNKGLVIAEIELNKEKAQFIKPPYLGEEVTGKKEYYNSYISKNPFRFWK